MFFTKVRPAADIVCPLENIVIVHLLSRNLILHVLRIKPHTCTFMCVLVVNWYIMLACLIIYLRVIIQVKTEEITIPQKKCAIGNAYFRTRHINVWLFWWISWTYSFWLPILSSMVIYSKLFVIIFHQLLDHFHSELPVRHCLLIETFFLGDVWVAPIYA